MNFLMITLVLMVGAYSIAGLPRYLPFSRDGTEIAQVDPSFDVASPLMRIPRRTEDSIQAAVAQNNAKKFEPGPRIERAPTNILHYVDFGGHTGENGAFGWYADFPAHQ